MIDTLIVGNALNFFELGRDPKEKSPEWRNARNSWLKEQGIGGIITPEGKKSKSLPTWWPSETRFWFISEEDEVAFVLKWS